MSSNQWLMYVKTAKEYDRLETTLEGIPEFWIDWVEKQVKSAEKRGIKIDNQLSYRIASLWNGIVLLQESKFICDTVENALRKAVEDFIFKNSLSYQQLIIPNWKRISIEVEQLPNGPSISIILKHMTFYELCGLINKNWSGIPKFNRSVTGLCTIFWNSFECRDKNMFISDMGFIRRERNRIAHSKELFKSSDTQKLYKISCRWLKPLNVELKERILSYRNIRPNFLNDLHLT